METITFTKPFTVTRFNDNGSIKILGKYATLSEAREAFDRWSAKFPNAAIDIDDLRNLL